MWVTDTPVSGWVSNNGAGLVVGLEVSPTRRKLDIQIPEEEYVYITAQPSTLRQGHTMYPGRLEPARATPAYTCDLTPVLLHLSEKNVGLQPPAGIFP